MKKAFSIIAVLCVALSLAAEKYTIVFKSGNGSSDSGSKVSDINKIVAESSYNCVQSIITANNIYNAGSGKGIKGGTGSLKGELTLALDAPYAIRTMTVYAASYSNKSDTAASKGISVCGKEIIWETNHKAEIRPYALSLDGNYSSLPIAALTASNNRWYVQRIEFEAADPNPEKATFGTPYAIDCGSVPIETGEYTEDVVNISITAKHVNGPIDLQLQKGIVFSLGGNTLPSIGGEVDLAYRLNYTGTVEDELHISAKGMDGQTTAQTIPLKINGYKYTPPTFHVDSSCMAIGPMPGDYYERAQGTRDSVLKSKLGEIIYCGVRYKYGSGNRKTWDGFYYTDRDTNTNRVLDMYSDNVRYFNPETPTASVAEFDIEHMLPKSWWGGTVNEAYCDLYHLVPGDYSANRSKSNHAPGIPSDTTFWNGSFATGSGAEYGLQKVFCPADEYKGDFARAYFYIATCYGDSLQWIETGEPGAAMTNTGWQEFRPWLRDLLLRWHRMDPVSKKELDRAVQVNKIQGNRNPFIDYPELVEYIWGDKQGTAVDFRKLIQSYGDNYDDTPSGIRTAPSENTSTRKEIRQGRIVVIRNQSIYSILGQQIQ